MCYAFLFIFCWNQSILSRNVNQYRAKWVPTLIKYWLPHRKNFVPISLVGFVFYLLPANWHVYVNDKYFIMVEKFNLHQYSNVHSVAIYSRTMRVANKHTAVYHYFISTYILLGLYICRFLCWVSFCMRIWQQNLHIFTYMAVPVNYCQLFKIIEVYTIKTKLTNFAVKILIHALDIFPVYWDMCCRSVLYAACVASHAEPVEVAKVFWGCPLQRCLHTEVISLST